MQFFDLCVVQECIYTYTFLDHIYMHLHIHCTSKFGDHVVKRIIQSLRSSSILST